MSITVTIILIGLICIGLYLFNVIVLKPFKKQMIDQVERSRLKERNALLRKKEKHEERNAIKKDQQIKKRLKTKRKI